MQNSRTEPWLLFVTTLAKAQFIVAEVMQRFFGTLAENCTRFTQFKEGLAAASERCGLDMNAALTEPGRLSPQGFLRLFTLAFGK